MSNLSLSCKLDSSVLIYKTGVGFTLNPKNSLLLVNEFASCNARMTYQL